MTYAHLQPLAAQEAGRAASRPRPAEHVRGRGEARDLTGTGAGQADALPRQVGRRIGESFLNPQMAQ
jgi:hypothetical protein